VKWRIGILEEKKTDSISSEPDSKKRPGKQNETPLKEAENPKVSRLFL